MIDIHLFGILVSPFVRDMAVAVLIFVPLRFLFGRAGLDRFVWHRPLADVAALGCILACVTIGFAALAGIHP